MTPIRHNGRFSIASFSNGHAACRADAKRPIACDMDAGTRNLLAVAAIVAPAIHTLTDGMEWVQAGFSSPQLWLNYLAFLPVPVILLGLYAAQRPAMNKLGLVGAILYGFSFVYFAHTTLFALAIGSPDYETLWVELGSVYSVHGVVMIVGGSLFGSCTLRARVFPAWTAWLFLAGIIMNLTLGILPLPDVLQTLGTTLRNAGLIGMGWALARTDLVLAS